MKSIRPGKQRKNFFNAPLHKKRKWISAHLEENLLLKYDKRSTSVIKGDTVKVMRGSYRGHEDKVAHVNVNRGYVEVEGLTITKADGKKIAKHLHPSNLLITKLNITDKRRREKLERGLPEETKKEIEKEAEEQAKEMEEQKRKEKEEKVKEEEIREPTEKLEEAKDETKKVEEKTEEPKAKKKTAKKTTTKKKNKEENKK